ADVIRFVAKGINHHTVPTMFNPPTPRNHVRDSTVLISITQVQTIHTGRLRFSTMRKRMRKLITCR
ncbi:MAG: hypothetical protein KC546_16555, partial [Anaerolineae bacterium]|nr:hypothetical protein [Anaerolineae bacterium]